MEMSGQLNTLVTLPPVPNEYEAGWPPELVWTGPTDSLDTAEKIKIFSCQESNPGHPAYSLLLYRLLTH
jgi:hypothetical protein